MYIISTFMHSTYLELALITLEQQGVSKDDILVAPMDKENRNPAESNLHHTHANASSRYDLAFILASVFMLLGTIYGFVLEWGPIIWAIIGLIAGAIVGYIIDSIITRKTSKTGNASASEVVVLIYCSDELQEKVERILWNNQASGVSKIK